MSISVALKLETIECWSCGGVYALTSNYEQMRRQDGVCWNCPYCRSPTHYGDCDNDRLRKKLSEQQAATIREQQRHDQTKAALTETTNRLNAEKAAKARLKNRVSNGVCPCCNRTFKDLARHMKSKHPTEVKR